ncbi:conserved hypothetical protein [Ricinus communis]|uniref:Uncharacterized protein n=1 Tax=Ricinus communis TaxID=3988 RepID=B9SZI6_RICCO|nr:conserved hypothetical protein [Ricinus communis]
MDAVGMLVAANLNLGKPCLHAKTTWPYSSADFLISGGREMISSAQMLDVMMFLMCSSIALIDDCGG